MSRSHFSETYNHTKYKLHINLLNNYIISLWVPLIIFVSITIIWYLLTVHFNENELEIDASALDDMIDQAYIEKVDPDLHENLRAILRYA